MHMNEFYNLKITIRCKNEFFKCFIKDYTKTFKYTTKDKHSNVSKTNLVAFKEHDYYILIRRLSLF